MGDREVYLVSADDEIYLGRVREFIEGDFSPGQGASVTAVISDWVSELAFSDYLPDFIIKQNFSIELRVSGVS